MDWLLASNGQPLLSENRNLETLINPLNQNPGHKIIKLRKRVTQFKKESQLLLERFLRGEISQTDAQAEARRIEAEVADAERRVKVLEGSMEV